MRYLEEKLQVKNIKGAGEVLLCCYIPDNPPEMNADRKRPAVLVLPGGGYQHVSPREKEPVALEFLAAGMCAFTLTYSVEPEVVFPQALCEACLAVDYIRSHGEEFHIDPSNISVCGFSAGGHLAATVGAFWNRDFVKDVIGEDKNCRPNKLILGYPVISSGEYAHRGSFDNVLGARKDDPNMLELLSLEHQVTEDFPPTFLWHTFTDNAVPVMNSLLLAQALAKSQVLTELHIYPEGVHGLSLGNHLVEPDRDFDYHHPCEEWVKKAVDFIYRY